MFNNENELHLQGIRGRSKTSRKRHVILFHRIKSKNMQKSLDICDKAIKKEQNTKFRRVLSKREKKVIRTGRGI